MPSEWTAAAEPDQLCSFRQWDRRRTVRRFSVDFCAHDLPLAPASDRGGGQSHLWWLLPTPSLAPSPCRYALFSICGRSHRLNSCAAGTGEKGVLLALQVAGRHVSGLHCHLARPLLEWTTRAEGNEEAMASSEAGACRLSFSLPVL